jgi:ABC-type Fe3+/spermidine/putrescine transport system ATPase subunit
MTTLTLHNLSKEYTPGEPAVADLNLSIEAGELMVLLGPSGSGKTTTLRMIAGLIPPTRGDICFNGKSVLALPPEKRSIGMVFQDASLFPFLSVGRNVAFGLRIRKMAGTQIDERVTSALEAVQLPNFDSRHPNELSGGQRQRVALARALIIQPRLLLLDEPMSNLDRGLREDLRRMIRALQQEAGITTLFVTHDQTEALAIADRIALLIDGRLRQVGTPQDFYEKPVDAEAARFFGASNLIPGTKRGELVDTPFGVIEISGSAQKDGPVLLLIRAEAIEIGANSHNNFTGCVRSSNYQGSAAHYLVGIEDTELSLATTPYSKYNTGDRLALHLPRERIRVLPARNGNL